MFHVWQEILFGSFSLNYDKSHKVYKNLYKVCCEKEIYNTRPTLHIYILLNK